MLPDYPDPLQQAAIAREIWDLKYRLKAADGTPIDATIDDTWWRVARAAASAEQGGKRVRDRWAERFHAMLADFTVLPAGRIIAGAGTGRRVTLANCFVLGEIEDDLGSIFDNVKDAALTMQQGGGIGHDFSTLRPNGAAVRSTGSDASGPVIFMDVWDAMCRSIMSAGSRRGAMMGTMRCDHPDIEAFIAAKSESGRLRNFNLSVLVTDAFMDAVRLDRSWDLVFAGRVYRTVAARDLWNRLMLATYDYAEPGVIFIDRVNAQNNLGYCEQIFATNPCGEQPLPPYGACFLGSINIARLIRQPFTPDAALDEIALDERVGLAVRFLDNVIDISGYPLAAQHKEAKAKRRIGLGLTGLADALIFAGVTYGAPESLALAERWMARIERAAYLASSELAAEKGSFPLFDREQFLARPGPSRLPPDVRRQIESSGLRNGCLTSIAPTGTISLLAGNVSGGVEPVFDLEYRRRLRRPDGSTQDESVADFAYRVFRSKFGESERLPEAFVTATQLSPRAHLQMQAALQRHVDSSISKTINCPAELPFESFETVYLQAYELGLKGCTTFRPNAVTGAVLSSEGAAVASPTVAPLPSAASTGLDASAAVPLVTGIVPVSASTPSSPSRGHASDGVSARLEDARSTHSPEVADGVIYMAKPLERDTALAGFTYKLKWPGSDHAIYVTINDIERDGRRRPFEIFINTKNLDHYAWTVALTRMISAVFRRGGDVAFVVDELKAIFDPQGGHWVGGRYVPSLQAAIGDVIETHMLRTGSMQADHRLDDAERDRAAAPQRLRSGHDTGRPTWPPMATEAPGAELEPWRGVDARTGATGDDTARSIGSGRSATYSPASERAAEAEVRNARPGSGRLCPRCLQPSLVVQEGCYVCRSCGYSRCS